MDGLFNTFTGGANMKPMLPELTFTIPEGDGWVYETKYDGFRAMMEITTNGIRLTSRNGKNLLPQFPEAEYFFKTFHEKMTPYLPCILDGELCILENPYKSDFFLMQKRGRLRSEKRIQQLMETHPAKMLVFDLLVISGKNITGKPFSERKNRLTSLFQELRLPIHPQPDNDIFLQMVPCEHDFKNYGKQSKNITGKE